jgi:hypothetical protein
MELDNQQVEIIGRNLLVSMLTADGVEVAMPIRDRGTDLIAFKDTYQGGRFSAVPIQVKAFSKTGFSLDVKYKGMLIAYIWYASTPLEAEVFVMSYSQAEAIVDSTYYLEHGRWANTQPGRNISEGLKPYLCKPGYLESLIDAL